MAKKLIFSCLMLLFPISILAQKSVLFDFSKYSEDEKIPFRIEEEGIVLEFSTRSKKLYSPKCSVINGCSCVRLVSDSLLTIKGVSCEITSVIFSIVDDKKRLSVYDDDNKMPTSKEKREGRFLIDRNGKVINKVFHLLLRPVKVVALRL